MPSAKALADPLGFIAKLEGRFRIRNPHLIKALFVFLLWKIKAVGSLVTQHKHEGLFFLSAFLLLLYPIKSHVGDYGGVISGNNFPLTVVHAEFGVEVFSLSTMSDEVVEARALAVIVFAHMPLADIGGGVSVALELTGKGRKIPGIVGEIIHDTMGMSIEPSENRSATR